MVIRPVKKRRGARGESERVGERGDLTELEELCDAVTSSPFVRRALCRVAVSGEKGRWDSACPVVPLKNFAYPLEVAKRVVRFFFGALPLLFHGPSSADTDFLSALDECGVEGRLMFIACTLASCSLSSDLKLLPGALLVLRSPEKAPSAVTMLLVLCADRPPGNEESPHDVVGRWIDVFLDSMTQTEQCMTVPLAALVIQRLALLALPSGLLETAAFRSRYFDARRWRSLARTRRGMRLLAADRSDSGVRKASSLLGFAAAGIDEVDTRHRTVR